MKATELPQGIISYQTNEHYKHKTGLEVVQQAVRPLNARTLQPGEPPFTVLFSRQLTKSQQWWSEHFICVVKLNICK